MNLSFLNRLFAPKPASVRLRIDILPREDRFVLPLADWIHAEWAHLNPHRTLNQVRQRLKKRAGSRGVPLTLLARDGANPIGTASLIPSDMDGLRESVPMLGAVYVLPRYRGRGIGRALCERVEEEARRLGLQSLYLFTEDRESFYESLGWQTEESCRYRGYSVVVMKRSLMRG